eukprot:271252_1
MYWMEREKDWLGSEQIEMTLLSALQRSNALYQRESEPILALHISTYGGDGSVSAMPMTSHSSVSSSTKRSFAGIDGSNGELAQFLIQCEVCIVWISRSNAAKKWMIKKQRFKR